MGNVDKSYERLIAPESAPMSAKYERAAASRNDFVDALTAIVNSTRPISWRSAVITLIGLTMATALRAMFGSAAAHFPLTFFILAILAVELLAGFPAAVVAACSSVLIVWWAFLEPIFQFARSNTSDLALLFLFATESAAAILIGYWCRVALMRLHSHQQAYRAIARELSHRNKNSLAVFEAIIRKSLEGDDRRTEAIVGRLRSLSHLNDILINPSTSSLELDSLLAHEFAPYGRDRVNTRCPRIQVQTSAVKNLLLIFHELVTNAAKYGALSNSTGRIDITWLIQGNVVVMHWCEKGGPPVQVPKTQGFGSSLMRHCAAALHGSIRSDFDPKGFKCTLEFALRGKDGGQILAA